MSKPLDTSNFTIDTPVLVSINKRGIYIPEVKGYTPIRCYIPIEKVITIMNRGIYVEFPNQSDQREISLKIEDIIYDYNLAKEEASKKKGVEVGTNVDNALDIIQDINETTKTKEVRDAEKESESIFDYSEQTERIVKNLSNTDFMARVLSDDAKYMTADERLEKAERDRKSRESLNRKKKMAYQDLSDQAAALNLLMQDAKYEESDFNAYRDEDLAKDFRDSENRSNKKKERFVI